MSSVGSIYPCLHAQQTFFFNKKQFSYSLEIKSGLYNINMVEDIMIVKSLLLNVLLF